MFRYWYRVIIGSPGSMLLAAIVLVTLSGVALADFTFGPPVDQTIAIPVLDPAYENPFCFAADGLEMYICSYRPGVYGDFDIWVLERDSIDANWPPAKHLGPAVNAPNGAGAPYISPDGLELYFCAIRPEGYGDYDLYVTTRATKDDPWGEAKNLGPKVNGSSFDAFGWLTPDGLELYFQSNRPGGYGGFDIYVSKRATRKDPWGEAQNLGPVINSTYDEAQLALSPDGLVLFFNDFYGTTPRPGGSGASDMWMTRRANLSAPWGAPVNLGTNVNSLGSDLIPRVSPDGSTLYYCSEAASGVWYNWQAPILPIVDFNGDKKVDLIDLVMLVDNWGLNKTLCDIGPFAWGDGKVDIEDLKVFMTYYEKENPPKANGGK